MKKVTFSCLALATLLQLIPSNGNAANIQDQKKKTNRNEAGHNPRQSLKRTCQPF